MLSDLLLQGVGIAVFLMPLMIALLGARWFRSREVASPGAKAIGAAVLLVFVGTASATAPLNQNLPFVSGSFAAGDEMTASRGDWLRGSLAEGQGGGWQDHRIPCNPGSNVHSGINKTTS